jgi:hypothetical protein
VWQDRPAEEPWCPAELRAHLGDGLAWLAAYEYRDADARAEEAHAGWRALAATRRGRVHAHAGAHREDAYAVAAAGGTLVAVVSDGAGSSRYSRVGAEVTCREAAAAAARALAADPARDAAALGAALAAGVAAASAALRGLAERAGVAPRDFRCTALAVALHDGRRRAAPRATPPPARWRSSRSATGSSRCAPPTASCACSAARTAASSRAT